MEERHMDEIDPFLIKMWSQLKRKWKGGHMDEIDPFLIKMWSQLKRKWKGGHMDEIDPFSIKNCVCYLEHKNIIKHRDFDCFCYLEHKKHYKTQRCSMFLLSGTQKTL